MSKEMVHCPDCGFSLRPIRLLVETGENRQVELAYAPAEAPKGVISDRYAVEGRVRARICQRCNRIVLSGEPL